MNKRVKYDDYLIYRDVISIISKYCDTQTWGRLKKSCKLFNKILVSPPREFKPLIRRLLYQLDGAVLLDDINYYFKRLNAKEYQNNYWIGFYCISSSDGSIISHPTRQLLGNIYNNSIEELSNFIKLILLRLSIK